MKAQAIRAPHLGVWSPLPPATDNPAAKAPGMPAAVRAHLAALREQARARYAAQVKTFPDVWHW